MRFLFVGLGSIGRRHVRNLASLGDTQFAAYRTTPGPPDDFEKTFNIRRVASYDEGLALAPDAVFITNPTALHLPYATKALQHGRHVFVEKPLSGSLDGVGEIEQLARAHDRVVFVGYQLRFHPILRTIKEHIARRTLGDPFAAHLEVGQYLPDWHPGEDYTRSYAARADLGGGAILTLSHELDYAGWLFGPAQSVYSLGGHKSALRLDVEDVAKILVEFVSGVIADIHLDYIQRPRARRLTILFQKGKLEWDYFSDRAIVHPYAGDPHAITVPPGFDTNALFREEAAHFLKVIQGEEPSAIPLASAIESLRLALAARESLEKKSPVLLHP